MKELYKVRKITVSLLDRTTHETYKDVPCEFGIIKDKEGQKILSSIKDNMKHIYSMMRISPFLITKI